MGLNTFRDMFRSGDCSATFTSITAMNYSTVKHTTALLKSLAKLQAVLKLVFVLGKHETPSPYHFRVQNAAWVEPRFLSSAPTHTLLLRKKVLIFSIVWKDLIQMVFESVSPLAIEERFTLSKWKLSKMELLVCIPQFQNSTFHCISLYSKTTCTLRSNSAVLNREFQSNSREIFLKKALNCSCLVKRTVTLLLSFCFVTLIYIIRLFIDTVLFWNIRNMKCL